MPKPLLKSESRLTQDTVSDYATYLQQKEETAKRQQDMSRQQLDRLLRKPRSKAYMEAMRKLDAGGHARNRKAIEEIIDAIRNELPEVELSQFLRGIVARCYLGDPYEVHNLNLTGDIVHHFKRGESMPYGLEKARSLAIRGNYEFIEVYDDCFRAISPSGSVAVIPLNSQ